MVIASLNQLHSKYPDELQKGISQFECHRDHDLVDFLQSRSVLFEQKAKSRTYLIIDEEELPRGNISIVAYFSVAPQIMYIPPNLSVRKIQRLDGFSGKIHGKKINALPVFLIGQLAKNDHYAESITGHGVLRYVWSIIGKVYNAIGGRIVMVDVKSSADGLIRFYEREGFKFVSADADTGLSQLIYMLNE